jgi:hypothetical protein
MSGVGAGASRRVVRRGFSRAAREYRARQYTEQEGTRAARIVELAARRNKSAIDRALLAEWRAAERAKEWLERARPQTQQRIERIKELQQRRQLSREERARRRYADELERAYGEKIDGIAEAFRELPKEAQDEIIAEARGLRQQYIDNEYKTLGKRLNYMIFYHSPV